MNAMEKLAREIKRVTEIKGHYEQTRDMKLKNVVVEPAIAMMEAELEAACVAAGNGDIVEMMAAIKTLEETTE